VSEESASSPRPASPVSTTRPSATCTERSSSARPSAIAVPRSPIRSPRSTSARQCCSSTCRRGRAHHSPSKRFRPPSSGRSRGSARPL